MRTVGGGPRRQCVRTVPVLGGDEAQGGRRRPGHAAKFAASEDAGDGWGSRS